MPQQRFPQRRPSPPASAPLLPRRQQAGLSGDLGGIRSIGQLLALLRPHFLPVSLATAPAAQGGTGQRVVSVTPATAGALNYAHDSDVVSLAAGTAQWIFETSFATPPTISHMPEGSPPSAGTTLFLTDLSVRGVTINSTDDTDVRFIHLHAIGQPGPQAAT